jgi:hypothetical protein
MVPEVEEEGMAKTERIYRRTEAGLRAYESPDSGLHAQQRGILGLIESDTHSDLIRNALRRRFGDKQVEAWLSDLEKRGFLEAVEVTPEHDLDFTGSLSLAELRARQAA